MLDNAPVEFFEALDSTMLEARRRAEQGAFGPVWLLAGVQESGRGRRGRAWASLAGNLHATLLAPNVRAPAELALMGFAAGLAVAEAAEAFIGAGRVALKWPNDALIDGAKLSGLMLDSGAGWMALGVGVNLAAAPEALDQRASCIAAYAPAPSPRAFLDQLAARLAYWDGRLICEGFEPLRQAWLARAYGLGANARVEGGAGVLEGRIAGLSPRGELELDTSAGFVRIAAGDIILAQTEAA
jgi:BirA family transcriptional regulator, biotin operon repressor / biotin---[acetyl-CoA-carboxylase] ligase